MNFVSWESFVDFSFKSGQKEDKKPVSVDEVILNEEKINLISKEAIVAPSELPMSTERFAQEAAGTLLGNAQIQKVSNADSNAWFIEAWNPVKKLAKHLGMHCGAEGMLPCKADELLEVGDQGKRIFLIDTEHTSAGQIQQMLSRLQEESFLVLRQTNTSSSATNLIIQKSSSRGLTMSLVSAGDGLEYHQSETLKLRSHPLEGSQQGKPLYEQACTFESIDESVVNTEGFWKDLLEEEGVRKSSKDAYTFTSNFLSYYGNRVVIESPDAAQELSELFTSSQPLACGQQVMFATARFIILSQAPSLKEGRKNYKHYQLTYKLRSTVLMARDYLNTQRYDPSQHALIDKSLTVLNERVDKAFREEPDRLIDQECRDAIKANLLQIRKAIEPIKKDFEGRDFAQWTEKFIQLDPLGEEERLLEEEDQVSKEELPPSTLNLSSWEDIPGELLHEKINALKESCLQAVTLEDYVKVTDFLLTELPFVKALIPQFEQLNLEQRTSLFQSLKALHEHVVYRDHRINFCSRERRLHSRRLIGALSKLELLMNESMRGEESLEQIRSFASVYTQAPSDYMGLFPDAFSPFEEKVFKDLEEYYAKYVEPDHLKAEHQKVEVCLKNGEDYYLDKKFYQSFDDKEDVTSEKFKITKSGLKKFGLNENWISEHTSIRDLVAILNGKKEAPSDLKEALSYRRCCFRKRLFFSHFCRNRGKFEERLLCLEDLDFYLVDGIQDDLDHYYSKKEVSFFYINQWEWGKNRPVNYLKQSNRLLNSKFPLIDPQKIHDFLSVKEPKTAEGLTHLLNSIDSLIHQFKELVSDEGISQQRFQRALILIKCLRKLPPPQDPLWVEIGANSDPSQVKQLIIGVARFLNSNNQLNHELKIYNRIGKCDRTVTVSTKETALTDFSLPFGLSICHLTLIFFEVVKASNSDFVNFYLPLPAMETYSDIDLAWLSREDRELFLNLKKYIKDSSKNEEGGLLLDWIKNSYHFRNQLFNPFNEKILPHLTWQDSCGIDELLRFLVKSKVKPIEGETAKIYRLDREEKAPFSAQNQLELTQAAGSPASLLGLERFLTSCLEGMHTIQVSTIQRLSKTLMNNPYLEAQLNANPQLMKSYSQQLRKLRDSLRFKGQYSLVFSLLHLEARLLICEAGDRPDKRQGAADQVRSLVKEALTTVKSYKLPSDLREGPLYGMILLAELPQDWWSDLDKVDFSACFRVHAYLMGEQGLEFPSKLDARLTSFHHLFCKSFFTSEREAAVLGKALEKALGVFLPQPLTWSLEEEGLVALGNGKKICWDFDRHRLTVDGEELGDDQVNQLNLVKSYLAQQRGLNIVTESVQQEADTYFAEDGEGRLYTVLARRVKGLDDVFTYKVSTQFDKKSYILDHQSPSVDKIFQHVSRLLALFTEDLAFMLPAEGESTDLCHILHRGKPILSLPREESGYDLKKIVRFSEPQLYLREPCQAARSAQSKEKTLADLLAMLGPQASVWSDEQHRLKRVEAHHLKLTLEAETVTVKVRGQPDRKEERLVVKGSGGFYLSPDQNTPLKEGYIPGGILLRNAKGEKKLLILSPDFSKMPEIPGFKEEIGDEIDPFFIKGSHGRAQVQAYRFIDIEESAGVQTLVPQSYSDCLLLCTYFAKRKKYQQLRLYLNRLSLVSAFSEQDKRTLRALFQTLAGQKTPEARALALAVFAHSQKAEFTFPNQRSLLSEKEASRVLLDYQTFRRPNLEIDLTEEERGIIQPRLKAATREQKKTQRIAPVPIATLSRGIPLSPWLIAGEDKDNFYKLDTDSAIRELQRLGGGFLGEIESLSAREICEKIQKHPHYVWGILFACIEHPELKQKLQIACLRSRSSFPEADGAFSHELAATFDNLDRFIRAERAPDLVKKAWVELFESYKSHHWQKKTEEARFFESKEEFQKADTVERGDSASKDQTFEAIFAKNSDLNWSMKEEDKEFKEVLLKESKEIHETLGDVLGKPFAAFFENNTAPLVEEYFELLREVNKKKDLEEADRTRILQEGRTRILEEVQREKKELFAKAAALDEDDAEVFKKASDELAAFKESLDLNNRQDSDVEAFTKKARYTFYALQTARFLETYFSHIAEDIKRQESVRTELFKEFLEASDPAFSYPTRRSIEPRKGSRRRTLTQRPKKSPCQKFTSSEAIPLVLHERAESHQKAKQSFIEDCSGKALQWIQSREKEEQEAAQQWIIEQAQNRQKQALSKVKDLAKEIEAQVNQHKRGFESLDKQTYKVTLSRLIHAWRHRGRTSHSSSTSYQGLLYLDEAELKRLDCMISEYLTLKAQADDWKRLIKKLEGPSSHGAEAFIESALAAFCPEPHYKASDDKPIDRLFLNMEALGGIRLREKQVNFMRTFWHFCEEGKLSAEDIQELSKVIDAGEGSSIEKSELSEPAKELLAQIGTGSGKTKVLAPLMQEALVMLKEQGLLPPTLTAAIYPKSLFQTNVEDSNNYLQNIFGHASYVFYLTREDMDPKDTSKLEFLSSKLDLILLEAEIAIKEGWTFQTHPSTANTLRASHFIFLDEHSALANKDSDRGLLLNDCISKITQLRKALTKGHTTNDECHMTQDPVSGNLQFAMGERLSLKPEWIDLLAYLFEALTTPDNPEDSLGIAQNLQKRKLQEWENQAEKNREAGEKKSYKSVIIPQLAAKITEYLSGKFPISNEEKKELLEYLESPAKEKLPAILENKSYDELIYLARHMIHKELPSALKREVNLHYGFIKNQRMERIDPYEAVVSPYQGADTPSIGSEYEILYTAAASFIALIYEGLTFKQEVKLAGFLIERVNTEAKRKGRLVKETRAWIRVRRCFGPDINYEQLQKLAAGQAYPYERGDQLKEASAIAYLRIFGSEQFKYFEEKCGGSPQTQSGQLGAIYHYSATVGHPAKYGSKAQVRALPNLDKEKAKATLRRKVCGKEDLVSMNFSSPHKASKKLIKKVLETPGVYILVESAAFTKGIDSEKFARAFLVELKKERKKEGGGRRPEIQAVEFFIGDKTYILTIDNLDTPTPSKDFPLPEDQVLRCCDQGHLFGADFLLPLDARGIITVSLSTGINELLQAVGRLRGFEDGQTVQVIVERQRMHKDGLDTAERPIDVLIEACEELEKRYENYQIFLSACQKLDNVLERAVDEKLLQAVSVEEQVNLFTGARSFLITSNSPDLAALGGGSMLPQSFEDRLTEALSKTQDSLNKFLRQGVINEDEYVARLEELEAIVTEFKKLKIQESSDVPEAQHSVEAIREQKAIKEEQKQVFTEVLHRAEKPDEIEPCEWPYNILNDAYLPYHEGKSDAPVSKKIYKTEEKKEKESEKLSKESYSLLFSLFENGIKNPLSSIRRLDASMKGRGKARLYALAGWGCVKLVSSIALQVFLFVCAGKQGMKVLKQRKFSPTLAHDFLAAITLLQLATLSLYGLAFYPWGQRVRALKAEGDPAQEKLRYSGVSEVTRAAIAALAKNDPEKPQFGLKGFEELRKKLGESYSQPIHDFFHPYPSLQSFVTEDMWRKPLTPEEKEALNLDPQEEHRYTGPFAEIQPQYDAVLVVYDGEQIGTILGTAQDQKIWAKQIADDRRLYKVRKTDRKRQVEIRYIESGNYLPCAVKARQENVNSVETERMVKWERIKWKLFKGSFDLAEEELVEFQSRVNELGSGEKLKLKEFLNGLLEIKNSPRGLSSFEGDEEMSFALFDFLS